MNWKEYISEEFINEDIIPLEVKDLEPDLKKFFTRFKSSVLRINWITQNKKMNIALDASLGKGSTFYPKDLKQIAKFSNLEWMGFDSSTNTIRFVFKK